MRKLLPKSGPAWLILITIGALVILQIVTLAMAVYAASDSSRTADLLRLGERISGVMRAVHDAPSGSPEAAIASLNAASLSVSIGKAPAVTDLVAADDELAELEDILLAKVASLGAIDLRVAEVGDRNTFGSIFATTESNEPGPVENDLSQLSSAFAKTGRFVASIQLTEGSWINVSSPVSPPPALLSPDTIKWYALLFLLVVGGSIWAVRQLTAPYRELEMAVTKIGHNLRVAPLAETGSSEVRRVFRAINTMQEKLTEYVADYEYLAIALAHDLRTPITRMMIRCELPLSDAAWAAMDRDVHDLDGIVSSVLDFARSGIQGGVREPLDPVTLARSRCMEFSDARFIEPGAGDEPMVVEADPVALNRVLVNLLENAIQHGGQAQVSVVRLGACVVLTVTDDGPGIEDAELPNVVRPFYRLEASRNRQTGGIGLGLTIVDRIVASQGGAFKLENRPEGGLRASITLPLRAAMLSSGTAA